MNINEPASSSPFVAENRRILLIDDNLAIHEDYRKILVGRANNSELDELEAALFDAAPVDEKQLNFDVTSAYQGQEGLALVSQALEAANPFAMAFVDMRMPPGWDGLETIKRMWEVDPHLQVVICSAYSDHSWSELVNELPTVGQWLLLRKPFDSAEVSQLALALTMKWELERQSRERVSDLERIVAERTQELRQEMQSRLAAQVALRENDARIRAVFDTTQNGIVIFDEAGKLECANRSACQLFGIQEAEIARYNIADLVVGPEGSSLAGKDQTAYGATLADQAGMHAECTVLRHGNARVAVSVKVSCFISCSQRMYAALLQDLTDYKRLQNELAHSNKLQAVGQLAAGVAHEINTPLQYLSDNNMFFEESFETLRELVTKVEELSEDASEGERNHNAFLAVKQAAQELRANKILEELPSAIHDSTQGVRRVQEIVNSMRLMTEIDHESVVKIDLAELLRESATEAASQVQSETQIVWAIDDELPTISGMSDRLREAFAIILNNALYATNVVSLNNASARGLVTVRTRQQENWIEVEISDNGCGITAANRDRIFEPFFTTKAVGEGRGQGLALAYSTIVDGHRGEIEVESEVGNGTTFRVRLPLAESSASDAWQPTDELSLAAK